MGRVSLHCIPGPGGERGGRGDARGDRDPPPPAPRAGAVHGRQGGAPPARPHPEHGARPGRPRDAARARRPGLDPLAGRRAARGADRGGPGRPRARGPAPRAAEAASRRGRGGAADRARRAGRIAGRLLRARASHPAGGHARGGRRRVARVGAARARRGRGAGRAAGTRRAARAARPDLSALRLQRAGGRGGLHPLAAGGGARAAHRLRRVHPLRVPPRAPLRDARRRAPLRREVPEPGAGPVRRPAARAARGGAGDPAGRGAGAVAAAARGERRATRDRGGRRRRDDRDPGPGPRRRRARERARRRGRDVSGGGAGGPGRARRRRRPEERAPAARVELRARLRAGDRLCTGRRRRGAADGAQVASGGARGVSERGLDVLVVDDEGPALADLARQLRALSETGEVRTAAGGQEALRTLAERPFDVVFLDVRMPGIDGLELARVLRRFETPPAVVFVSAYETGAVGAFELKALDYLMKPVSRRRLAEALSRVREARGGATARAADDVVPLPTLRGGTRLVPRESILFLEADGDYVRVICDKERFLMRGRVSDLARRWRPHGFVQVHRGYVANLRRAVEVRPQLNGTATLAFPDGREIPVARRKVSELRKELVT